MSIERGYGGASATTRREVRSFVCSCGERFLVHLVRAVNVADDSDLATAFVVGRENRAHCPRCGSAREVQVSVVYHDPGAPRLLLVLPDGLRHRDLEERARLYQRIARDGEVPPDYVREFGVVFGLDELRLRLAIDSGAPHPTNPTNAAKAEGSGAPAVPGRASLEATGPLTSPLTGPLTSGDFNPAPAPTRAKPIGVAHSAPVERWLANREGPSALLTGDEVLVCFPMARADAEPFLDAPLELRVQLHRLPTYPVLVLTFVAPASADGTPRTLHALLEIGRAAHRAIIDRLSREFRCTLQLFDGDRSLIGTRDVRAALEPNMRRLFTAARNSLAATPAATRNFDRARAAWAADGYDRLGGATSSLCTALADPLASPHAVLDAINEISRWADPSAEAWLVEIRSFPLVDWTELRARVVERAVHFGLHVRRSLVEATVAASESSEPTHPLQSMGTLGEYGSWSDLLRREIAAFHALSIDDAGNDLTPQEEADNWRLLLEECLAAGVGMDPSVRAVAEARQIAVTRSERPSLADLGTLDTEELVGLLERKEARREAALLLCERREHVVLRQLFASLPKMTRAEANRVLPALVTAFGARAEPLLIEGLRSRKSYLRQGCALGLGTLASSAGASPMVELLLTEPTDVWREVARALGDLGAPSVPPLSRRFADARGEGRDRIVRALAHVVAHGASAPVEKLAAGADREMREAARLALGLEGEIRRGDEEVRGGEAPREQTVVRSFSRRFFDALGGDVELSEGDLEQLAGDADDESPAAVVDETESVDEADVLADDPAAHDSTDPRMNLPRDREA